MTQDRHFFNLHHHDFLRVAVAVPRVALADPRTNGERTLALMGQAAEAQAALVVFPELGLTGYSCDDLFHQESLLEAALQTLLRLVEASARLPVVAAVGLPLRRDALLYNCVALLGGGRVLGIVPKSYLPGYREFYEPRQFASSFTASAGVVDLPGHRSIPFGADLLFRSENQPLCTLALEICEDLWVPVPPSSFAALAGATVVINASASNATLGKAEYRRQLVCGQSARCQMAYLYSAAGSGESTTDLAWDGHALVADHGEIKAESERFADRDQLIVADLDLLRLSQERMRQNTFGMARQRHRTEVERYRVIPFPLPLVDQNELALLVSPPRFPYVPQDATRRGARCNEVFEIQVQGLLTRMRATGLSNLVLGLSGGLDSAHALLVACQVLDRLGLKRREHLYAYTLPGFATGTRSLALAQGLMNALDLEVREIDIRPSCLQMLRDIGHPFARGEAIYDITFENVQAGERTSHLFRLANLHHALVVGTSDLSELALGWSTYGVGDHMAHYHVNASVPKTLIQHLLGWVAETGLLSETLAPVLREVLAAEISPELVPAKASGEVQRSEASVGPYPLQDFNLYHTLRFGFDPRRIAFMAWCAWREAPADERPTLGEIRHWLEVFVVRFFRDSQFKRSCIANAPKVGSGGSLSPRGDWRAPSDASAQVWLEAARRIPTEQG